MLNFWKIFIVEKVLNVSPAVMKMRIAGGIGLFVAANSIYNVEAGHRALILNRKDGLKDETYPEGTHLKIPFFEKKVIYDVRPRPHLVETTAGSRDIQMVRVGLRVLSRPLVDQLPTIHRTLGKDYNEKVLPSIIDETLKSVIARYTASQLITQRENVSREIQRILAERALNFHIALEDVLITSLTSGKEFPAAIKGKHIAEDERAKYIVEAGQDNKSAVIGAQGEIATQGLSRTLDDASIAEEFEKWMAKYGRTYEDMTEKEKRFNIFKENFQYIENFNSAGNNSYKLGINNFSDLTHEEFSAIYLCKKFIDP